MEILNNSMIDVRASKGIVKDFADTPNEEQQPLSDYDLLLQMFRYDEVISTALDTTVEKTLSNGYEIFSESGSDDEIAYSKLNELNFNEVIENILYSYLIFGDAFLEVRKIGGVPKEIHPLETTEMLIKYNSHGEVLGYVQNSNKSTQIDFTTEQVIHFRNKWIGSQVYSYAPFEPIAKAYSTKVFASEYLKKLFVSLPPKYMFHLAGANQQQRDAFVQNLRFAQQKQTVQLVTYGSENSETKVTPLMPDFSSNGLLNVLEYLREQVLTITRVPPIWVGIVNNEGANRSNSEAQIESFEIKINNIQKKFENVINRQLFPLLGLEGYTFKFNSCSNKAAKAILENAAILKSIGLKNEALSEYLRYNGFNFEEDDFQDPMELQAMSNQTASNITAPSRKGSNGKKVNSNLDSDGVSDDSAKKLGVDKR